MKKLIVIVAVAILSLGAVQAQNPIPNGTKFLNLGLGFSNHGIPVSVGMDFGVGNDFSLGFDVSHRFNYTGC
jgi:outer membrane immunogenic protein